MYRICVKNDIFFVNAKSCIYINEKGWYNILNVYAYIQINEVATMLNTSCVAIE